MFKGFIIVIYLSHVQVIQIDDFYDIDQCNNMIKIITNIIRIGDVMENIQNIYSLDCINLLGDIPEDM